MSPTNRTSELAYNYNKLRSTADLAVYLAIFQLGCVIHALSSRSQPKIMTAGLLSGAGAAGMFACASAAITSPRCQPNVPHLWHFQYAVSIIIVMLPLLDRVFLPASHLVFCLDPVYKGIQSVATRLKTWNACSASDADTKKETKPCEG
ncbi:hypothetical protein B0H10DRAFT_2043018 [Mycena sp. CBHHK59/15]|nr:hypothetical protein B0H10DRAFT_2043018 [Mycena sp. CBHHK59/15]